MSFFTLNYIDMYTVYLNNYLETTHRSWPFFDDPNLPVANSPQGAFHFFRLFQVGKVPPEATRHGWQHAPKNPTGAERAYEPEDMMNLAKWFKVRSFKARWVIY